MLGTREQEPFSFPKATMQVVRKYIRLRYKLLPYLYNLFIDQEELGDPILRPLLYEHGDAGLENVDDQFLIGNAILQAPILSKERLRKVVLPGVEPWYDARTGEWVEPGEIETKVGVGETPMFFAAGAIVPMQLGTPISAHKNLSQVGIHIFIPTDWNGESSYEYRADDGISFDYREGKRSQISIRVASANGNVAVSWEQTQDGFGKVEPTFVVHGRPKSVRVNSAVTIQRSDRVVLAGKSLAVDVVKVR